MAFLTQLAPAAAPRLEALLRSKLLPGVSFKVPLPASGQASKSISRIGFRMRTSRCCCRSTR